MVLISGPSHLHPEYDGIDLHAVNTAEEMFDAVVSHANEADILVMAAAVADYTPIQKQETKIKKKEDNLQLELIKTKDILQHLGATKKKSQFLVGFALETHDEMEQAVLKLKKKNADCIILNSLRDAGAGFGKDTNVITIIDHNGHQTYPCKSKKEVAEDICRYVFSKMNELNEG